MQSQVNPIRIWGSVKLPPVKYFQASNLVTDTIWKCQLLKPFGTKCMGYFKQSKIVVYSCLSLDYQN